MNTIVESLNQAWNKIIIYCFYVLLFLIGINREIPIMNLYKLKTRIILGLHYEGADSGVFVFEMKGLEVYLILLFLSITGMAFFLVDLDKLRSG